MPQELNPLGNMVEVEEPPMSFAQIDKVLMQKLIELDQISPNMHPAQYLEQTNLLILGTIKELVRTLRHLHPEVPQILLPGNRQ